MKLKKNYKIKRTIVIIQARMQSSRLPGKVLKKIEDITIIELLYLRLLNIFEKSDIFFAIPDTFEDRELESTILALGANVVKGSHQNVYDRFSKVIALEKNVSSFIRITADCPLLSTSLIKEALFFFNSNNYAIVHSGIKVAEGLDFEIINAVEFLGLKEKKLSEIHLEHPTLYFYENRSEYNIFDFEPLDGCDDSKYRVTLDEELDLIVISQIAKHFNNNLTTVEWSAVRNFLDSNIDIFHINSKIVRNEGLLIHKKVKL